MNRYYVVVEMAARQLVLSEESEADFGLWSLRKQNDMRTESRFWISNGEGLSTVVFVGPAMVVTFLTESEFDELRRRAQLAQAANRAGSNLVHL